VEPKQRKPPAWRPTPPTVNWVAPIKPQVERAVLIKYLRATNSMGLGAFVIILYIATIAVLLSADWWLSFWMSETRSDKGQGLLFYLGIYSLISLAAIIVTYVMSPTLPSLAILLSSGFQPSHWTIDPEPGYCAYGQPTVSFRCNPSATVNQSLQSKLASAQSHARVAPYSSLAPSLSSLPAPSGPARRYMRQLGLLHMSVKASKSLHDELFESVLQCPLSFFDTTPVGRITARFRWVHLRVFSAP
jgi:hypothetical protein